MAQTSEREMSEREREFRRSWLAGVMESQDGVVARRQLLEGALSSRDVERMVRRRELRRIHPRVYVDHTGPLTWRQRAWAAVLYAEPAALCWTSLEEPKRDDPGAPIHVAIDQKRRIEPQAGIVVHRMTQLAKREFGGEPPRLRLEDNALAMAHEATTELEVVALLAAVVGRRGVSATSLEAALKRFPTLRRRRWISAIIDDLGSGTCSVLEHGYLVRVERAHGLPVGVRQAPRTTPQGREFRDVEYVDLGLVVELDGRLGHESWDAQGRDADRDLDDLALGGQESARLRWKQVYVAQAASSEARRAGRNSRGQRS